MTPLELCVRFRALVSEECHCPISWAQHEVEEIAMKLAVLMHEAFDASIRCRQQEFSQ